VLSPKAGVRVPAGSAVALTWSPSEALILGTGPHMTTEDMEEETP